MKLTIHQDLKFSETEITISCAAVDSRLERLIRLIRQHSFSLTGYADGCEYQLAAEQICYIESVDGKTFFYLEKEVYSAKETLAVLEQLLSGTAFARISKSCIVNTDFLKCVRPLYNHRLEAELKNGEKLIITRSYIEPLKQKLRGERL